CSLGSTEFARVRKNRIRHDVQNDRADGVESRKRQPEQSEQANVSLHSAGTGLGERYRAYDLLAAVVAEPLTWLHARTASIAEHDLSSSPYYLRLQLRKHSP